MTFLLDLETHLSQVFKQTNLDETEKELATFLYQCFCLLKVFHNDLKVIRQKPRFKINKLYLKLIGDLVIERGPCRERPEIQQIFNLTLNRISRLHAAYRDVELGNDVSTDLK